MANNGPTVPPALVPKMEFYENRIAKWVANAAGLNVPAATLTALSTLVENARKEYEEAQLARIAAKEATESQNLAVRLMGNAGADVIAVIKAFAESKPTVAERDAVLNLANLPIPTPPSAQPAPNMPTNVVVDPNANGTVTVKWKATSNAGAVYLVYRKLAGNNQFSQIGFVATKSIIDGSVPAGTVSCEYYIQAVRGAQTSPATMPVVVRFGAGGAAGFQGNIGMAA